MDYSIKNITYVCLAETGFIPSESKNECYATLRVTGTCKGRTLSCERKVMAVAESSLNKEEKNQYGIIQMTFNSPHHPTYYVGIQNKEISKIQELLVQTTLANDIWPNLSQESATFNKAEEKLINNLKEYEELLNTQMEIQIQPSSTKVRRSLSD